MDRKEIKGDRQSPFLIEKGGQGFLPKKSNCQAPPPFLQCPRKAGTVIDKRFRICYTAQMISEVMIRERLNSLKVLIITGLTQDSKIGSKGKR